jgi:membrane-bound lytic murein transglycosylase B
MDSARRRLSTLPVTWLAVACAVLAIIVFERLRLREQRPAPQPSPSPVVTSPSFSDWHADLKDEARSMGFSASLIEAALGTMQPADAVLEADRAQAAPGIGLDRYLAAQLTAERIATGRDRLRQHHAVLRRIERWFGVQRRFVVAIWGAESGYGRNAGDVPVFQALATLAWEPRRADYFRGELFDALRIVERGDIELKSMIGSWAGAMGQPQFMPSSYLRYAFDFDRDGQRDIWQSVPDSLASIANYLRHFGWRNGETWGREVILAPNDRERIIRQYPARSEGCGALRTLTIQRPISQWAADGVRLANGAALPRQTVKASLILTGDARTFLVYQNYEAILAYNCSHYYGLSVALLADQLQ